MHDSSTILSDRSGVTDAVRAQILATEHWSLLATRSMTWNEMFSRAAMFLTVLSAAVVALALVAQATGFGPGFRSFALPRHLGSWRHHIDPLGTIYAARGAHPATLPRCRRACHGLIWHADRHAWRGEAGHCGRYDAVHPSTTDS